MGLIDIFDNPGQKDEWLYELGVFLGNLDFRLQISYCDISFQFVRGILETRPSSIGIGKKRRWTQRLKHGTEPLWMNRLNY